MKNKSRLSSSQRRLLWKPKRRSPCGVQMPSPRGLPRKPSRGPRLFSMGSLALPNSTALVRDGDQRDEAERGREADAAERDGVRHPSEITRRTAGTPRVLPLSVGPTPEIFLSGSTQDDNYTSHYHSGHEKGVEMFRVCSSFL